MRLRSCLAVELVVGLGLVAGAVTGAAYGTRAALGYLSDTEASAAAATVDARARVEPVARVRAGRLDVATAAPVLGTVFPAADDALLAPLRDAKLVRVKINHGGTSLSLRLDFADGARAAFKPEQTFYQSNPRREIAAYRMDRLLGLGRVPPSFARTFSVAELLAAIDPSQQPWGAAKVEDEIVARGGTVTGEVSWWIPDIIDAKIQGQRVDMDEGIVLWHRYLRAGAPIPDDAVEMARQVSDVILFDFVIDNVDRWTLSNTKGTPDGRVLYFMDNTLSFSPFAAGRTKGQLYLHRAEKFSRRLVARLRALTREEVEQVCAGDGNFARLCAPDEVTGVLLRRDYAMQYIDQLVADHGEAAVLAFP